MNNYEYNLKNLIDSLDIDIDLYDKRKNIRTKKSLLKDIESIKKELKTMEKTYIQLSHLTNLNSSIQSDISLIKSKINNIDIIINYINGNEQNMRDYKINKLLNSGNIIEIYSN
jgi:hypothetical protein